MAIGKVILEAVEAASGGVLLNIFNKLFESGKEGEAKQLRQAFVRSGIFPFIWTSEDEAKLAARFGRIEKGLSANEALVLGGFLEKKCTPEERRAFRKSIALIEEVSKPIKITLEDKDAKKSQVIETEESSDYGLDFLKKMVDPSMNDQKRYTICKGLGLFDFPHAIQNAWKKADGGLTQAGAAIGSFREKMEESLLPQSLPAGTKKWPRFKHWLKNLF